MSVGSEAKRDSTRERLFSCLSILACILTSLFRRKLADLANFLSNVPQRSAACLWLTPHMYCIRALRLCIRSGPKVFSSGAMLLDLRSLSRALPLRPANLNKPQLFGGLLLDMVKAWLRTLGCGIQA